MSGEVVTTVTCDDCGASRIARDTDVTAECITIVTTTRPCDHADDAHDYRALADHVIEHLNPADDDIAELAIACDAIDEAVEFIEAQPCSCSSDAEDEGDPCRRCLVLGRCNDLRVGR